MLASNWNHTPHNLSPPPSHFPRLPPCVLSMLFSVFCFVLLFLCLSFANSCILSAHTNLLRFLSSSCVSRFTAIVAFVAFLWLHKFHFQARAQTGHARLLSSLVLPISSSPFPPTNNEFLLWGLTSNWLNFIYFICNARNISVAVFSLAATGHHHEKCRGKVGEGRREPQLSWKVDRKQCGVGNYVQFIDKCNSVGAVI